MRPLACGLLASIALAIPILSAACGASSAGVKGSDGGPSQDAGGKPDVKITRQPDATPPPDVPDGPDTGPVSTVYPASHPPLPQEVSLGGPVVTSPVIIPVIFPDDSYQSDIIAFTGTVGATPYWSTIVSQYGVGAATMGTPVILTSGQEPPGIGGTISDAQIQSWLQQQIGADAGPLAGTNTPNTVYAIFFPSGTTITLPEPQVVGGTAESCSTFFGYHGSLDLEPSGTNVTYAVIPRCGTIVEGSGMTLAGIDAITGAASHEYIEACTDPELITNMPAYIEPDPNDIIYFEVIGAGEIMDMCELNPGAFFQPPGFDYVVQRGWSNSAATAGRDPCEPQLPGEVYFNSVAALPDDVLISQGRQEFTTKALSLTLGVSKTVDVDLYSEARTSGPWTIQAFDEQSLGGGASALSFSWDATSGENGQVLHLTVKAESMPSGLDALILVSQLGSQTSLWMGAVEVK
jgi:hypothetical protein